MNNVVGFALPISVHTDLAEPGKIRPWQQWPLRFDSASMLSRAIQAKEQGEGHGVELLRASSHCVGDAPTCTLKLGRGVPVREITSSAEGCLSLAAY